MRAHSRRLGSKRRDTREFRAQKIKDGELAKANAPRPLAHRVNSAKMAAMTLSGVTHYQLPGGPRLCYDFGTGKTEPSDKAGDTALYGVGGDE